MRNAVRTSKTENPKLFFKRGFVSCVHLQVCREPGPQLLIAEILKPSCETSTANQRVKAMARDRARSSKNKHSSPCCDLKLKLKCNWIKGSAVFGVFSQTADTKRTSAGGNLQPSDGVFTQRAAEEQTLRHLFRGRGVRFASPLHTALCMFLN